MQSKKKFIFNTTILLPLWQHQKGIQRSEQHRIIKRKKDDEKERKEV